MAKVLELESNSDPNENENVDPKEKAKQDTEEMLQRLMKKAYVLGLSAGMKTMCGSILEKMNQNKKLNAQKQLNILRQWCEHALATQDKDNDAQENEQSTTSETNDETKVNEDVEQ